MNPGNKKLAQKAVAVVVIVALLDMVGVSPIVMLFMTGVAIVIWFAGRRSENRELERIFEFYVCADAILRDEERRWYGFEVAEVIENGERALELMPDAPSHRVRTLNRAANAIRCTESGASAAKACSSIPGRESQFAQRRQNDGGSRWSNSFFFPTSSRIPRRVFLFIAPVKLHCCAATNFRSVAGYLPRRKYYRAIMLTYRVSLV